MLWLEYFSFQGRGAIIDTIFNNGGEIDARFCEKCYVNGLQTPSSLSTFEKKVIKAV